MAPRRRTLSYKAAQAAAEAEEAAATAALAANKKEIDHMPIQEEEVLPIITRQRYVIQHILLQRILRYDPSSIKPKKPTKSKPQVHSESEEEVVQKKVQPKKTQTASTKWVHCC